MSLKFVYKKLSIPIIIATMGFTIFGFFCTGLFSHASMHTTVIGNAIGVSSPSQTCCDSIISHQQFSTWENALLVVPDRMRDNFILLALGLVLALGAGWQSFRDRHRLLDSNIGQLRLYARQNPDIVLFSHLRLAFARGILNPKIY